MSVSTMKMTTFRNINNKMVVDCSKTKLTQWRWLCIGVVIFTAEFAIGLVVVTVSLNQQLKSVQLLLSDSKTTSQTPSQDAPVSPGCYCPPEESRAAYHPDDDVEVSQYLKKSPMTESTSSSDVRIGQLHEDVRIANCCEVDAKTLRKHVKDYVRHRSKRSLPTNKISAVLSKRRKKRSMLILPTAISEKGDDVDMLEQKSNRTPKSRLCGAHLIGQFNREFSKGNGDTLREWTPESQGAYLMNMRYYEEDGHIRVTVPGYYYIYCQLHYRPIRAETLDPAEATNQLRYKVIQKIHSRPSHVHNTIISNAITPNHDQHDASYSAFESTVAYLEAGDVVFVKVWPQTREWQCIISSDHDRTFFGLILLSESSAV